MYILAILYFLLVFSLLGYSLRLLLFSNKESTLFEAFLTNLAAGLALFPLLIIFLNVVHLINWWVILLISAIMPVYKLLTSSSSWTFTLPKRMVIVVLMLVTVLFAIHLFMFIKGAFVYPYLEDGDPLAHALAAKFVSESGTYSTPADFRFVHYLPPYPPFYSSFMGVHVDLAQNDMLWTLKFFNALICSLGIFFIFQLVKELSGSYLKGLLAAFLLLSANSYLSHFIFAASYATTLIIPALYFLIQALKQLPEKSRKQSSWFSFKDVQWKQVLFVSIIFSSIFLVQPITSAMFLLVAGLAFLVFIRYRAHAKLVLYSILGGLVLSQLFWIPTIAYHGVDTWADVLGFHMFQNEPGGINNDSSGGIIYSLKDFVLAPEFNKIDQPTGVGLFLSLAFIIGVIYLILHYSRIRKENVFKAQTMLTLLLWVVIVGLMIQGNAFPVKFTPHRLWSYFTIGVVLIAALGFTEFFSRLPIPSKKTKSLLLVLVIIILVFGVIFSGLIPKYTVNTSLWPYGGLWSNQEELQGFLTMERELLHDTLVFGLCSYNDVDQKIASSNMNVRFLDREAARIQKDPSILLDETYDFNSFLKTRKYEYFVLEGSCVKTHGVDTAQSLLGNVSTQYPLVLQTNTFFLFQVQ